ncbi:MAG: S24/S26 family peptidase [Oscillospiraceae bacterium]|nr:S24/S26 family peptidase [Oscillospiraceae bacterium]
MSNLQGKKRVRLEELFPIIEEKLRLGGSVTFRPHGISMRPLIRQGKDSVTVEALAKTPQVGDVIFYRRPDGQFVLHRIVGEDKNGYILCGDNQKILEHGVKTEWIIGILTAVSRKGKVLECSGKCYNWYVKVVLPVWRIWVRLRGILGMIKRKINK